MFKRKATGYKYESPKYIQEIPERFFLTKFYFLNNDNIIPLKG